MALTIQVDGYTIEHILPQNQNLWSEWRDALGPNWRELQQQWLHTLGNLTLTGYNSEYSDHPFHVKRDMVGGFRESTLRLNQGLAQLPEWNVETIRKRAVHLADKALEIWTWPVIDSAIFKACASPIPTEHTQDSAQSIFALALQGDTLALFSELRKRIQNLDAGVRMSVHKQYLEFEAEDTGTFASVIPYKGGLRILLCIDINSVFDPEKLCTDISGRDHWGIGNVEIQPLTSECQLDGVMSLVRQSFELCMQRLQEIEG